MQVLNGVSASGGVCLGNVLVVSVPDRPGIQKRVVTRAEIDAGWEQFQRARGKVKKSLEALLDSPNQDARDIFKTHLLMLNDEVFISDFHMLYSRSFTNIEYMLNEHVNRFAENLRQSDVTLLAERSADISDVFGKVLDELAGYMGLDVSLVAPSSLVVARFLSPSDMLALAKQGVRGVCLEQGGITSHTAIIARVYGIPAVFGVKNAAKLMETGDFLIIDGIDSRVYLSPDDGTVSKFEHKAAVEAARKKRLEQFRDKPCRTKDGVDIALYANIGTVEEAEIARAENAAGIGLFRTEFLFMQARAALSEDTQLHAYRQVLKIMAGKPVVVRTLDAGGDKIIAAIDEALGGQEGGPAGARSGAKRLRTLYDKNPLLGQRGIRLTLAAPEVFKTQLRALLRAGIYGDLRIMLPLITRPEELTDTLHLIEVAKAELAAASIPYKADVPLGIMVETPATALTAGT
ncbi:MAG: phosphoenolpyruvate--protein phosphotransferase, partial [Spirochaetaceae bacterium]|nr:phosphoenolpyruvate--protein phosphotransferase [Spirochaetaceae bacterium]